MRPIHIIFVLIIFASHGLISDELKLTHPNGGEVFEAGAETTISWEGISDTTKVKLEFSSDNGASWSTVVDSVKGLSYLWKTPFIESDSCLVSIDPYNDKNSSYSNEGEIEWSKNFGGSDNEIANSIAKTYDGGYIVAGSAFSIDGDISNSKGLQFYWIVKLRKNGELEWEKSYGGSSGDLVQSVKQTYDGGYLVAGISQSINGDISNPKGLIFIWIVKLRKNGELEWEKSYGGSNYDYAYSVEQTFDGGYIIAGSSRSSDGDISENKGKNDYCILKLRENGELEWGKSYGGSESDVAYSVKQTFDGCYIVAGFSRSSDGDITNSKGNIHYWVLKLRENGELEWEKSYGGSSYDYAYSVIQTFDGGYIVVGHSESIDGDISKPLGDRDIWVLKLRENGELEWERSFGGSRNDYSTSIAQSSDGGFMIVGTSESKDGDITEPKGLLFYWILKLQGNGELEWEKSYGGSGKDYATSISHSTDGGIIIAGYSNSQDGDIINPKGNNDYWIIKLAGFPQPLLSDTSDTVFSIKAPEETIIPDFDYYAYTNE